MFQESYWHHNLGVTFYLDKVSGSNNQTHEQNIFLNSINYEFIRQFYSHDDMLLLSHATSHSEQHITLNLLREHISSEIDNKKNIEFWSPGAAAVFICQVLGDFIDMHVDRCICVKGGASRLLVSVKVSMTEYS